MRERRGGMRQFIRNLYLLGLALALAVGINSYSGLRHLEAPLRRELQRRTEAELQHLVGSIASSFGQMENDLNTAAYYVGVETDPVKTHHFLASLLENREYLAMYVASPGNPIVYVDGWIPPADFQAESRPWYRQAVGEGRAVYTAPYLDAAAERWVVTAAKPVYDSREQLLGVLGIDRSLDEVLSILEQVSTVEESHAFVFNARGELVLISSSLQEPDLDRICHLVDCTALEGLDQGTVSAQVGSVPGLLHWQTLEESGFIVAAFAPEYVVLGSSARTQQILGTVLFTFVGGLTVMVFFLRLHIVGPMRALERDILAISLEGDFSYRLPTGGDRALGQLRRTLNDTLQKVQEHFLRILEQRKELAAAYDQLVAHEQELQGQYRQIKEQQEQIRLLAEVDSLTGLYNRRKFQEDLKAELARGASGAVFMLDLDDFKLINDTLGHSFGDEVLRHLANLMRERLPREAACYRLGGDEFLVVLKRPLVEDSLRLYLDEFSRLMAQFVPHRDQQHPLTCSMGVVCYPQDGRTVDELLSKADIALHHAKKAGKNRCQLFDSSLAAAFSGRMQLEEDLVEAVQNHDFYLVYQPVVDARTGRTAYLEALLRLKGQDIPPSVFIPIAEELDLTVSLGRWVIGQVTAQLQKWQVEGVPLVPVAVNLSPKQFYDPDLLSLLRKELEEKGLACSHLELEITEAVLLDYPQQAVEVSRKLRALGFTVVLDDYGTGYSSIDYLARLGAKRVKLHETLTVKLSDYLPVLEGLLTITHGLGMEVVAEGVEQMEQARFLSEVGCDFLQGFIFSHPVEEEAAKGLLTTDFGPLLGLEREEKKEES